MSFAEFWPYFDTVLKVGLGGGITIASLWFYQRRHNLASSTATTVNRRLALLEENKTLPFSAVWDAYCEQQNVPVGSAWLDAVKKYESNVQLMR